MILKWQEKRAQNVHMIAIEERDDRPRVAAVMCGGERT
jgi:hypothetical protein